MGSCGLTHAQGRISRLGKECASVLAQLGDLHEALMGEMYRDHRILTEGLHGVWMGEQTRRRVPRVLESRSLNCGSESRKVYYYR